MKFSVIIPLYNKSGYVGKAIESVLSQDYTSLELILVNDGSTDDSLEVVQKYRDDRIVIINQNNKGVSTARNNGVKVAKYNYLAFLDADDWWDNGYLSAMKILIEKYPDSVLWAAKYYKVKSGKNIPAKIGLEKNFSDGYINYFNVYSKTMWMPVFPSSIVLLRAIFDKVGGFNQNLILGEDFDLWLRIAIKYKIAYLNKSLVYYNQDIAANERAIGGDKIWKPEQHYIFQLKKYQDSEASMPDLKRLLDKLRVRALYRYRIKNKYKTEVGSVLEGVVFSNVSIGWRIKYHLPLPLLRIWITIKRRGVGLKNKIYRFRIFR